MNFLRRLASLKVTLLGMALLAAGAMAIYGNPAQIPAWVLTVPLMVLALNLTAAIITNVRINQQPGLLVFHVCLLALVILAGVGRLTYLDSHVELPIGTRFDAAEMLDTRTGIFHQGNIDKVAFTQGEFSVEYSPGIQRGRTYSHVQLREASGRWVEQVIGDDSPLLSHGYRFYTTHNKGFTVVLHWMPDNGTPRLGTINMPSFPLFDYKQDNRWTPPESKKEIKFWLQLTTAMDVSKSWVLSHRNSSGVLVVTHRGQRTELGLGQSVDLGDGVLRFERLSMWMGYRIFYDPTIHWMFFISIAGVLGLGQYFWKKINLQPWMEAESSEGSDVTDAENTDEANGSVKNGSVKTATLPTKRGVV
ncbi:MAG: hypothetical protein OEZ68_08495 [Gammaproteobacteria bacterium]|nr:hypothetical protein [Gammaproteobacteria bacterium]MDH5800827.1 hypothetical protein [Gammaproteobacteria bacterium]